VKVVSGAVNRPIQNAYRPHIAFVLAPANPIDKFLQSHTRSGGSWPRRDSNVSAGLIELSGPVCQRGARMLLFTRSRALLISWGATAGLIVATTALAANLTEAPSLADYIATICSAAFRSAPPQESRFLSENVGAMTRMMTGMEIRPSGDVDQDFAAMMIPHHQGAMDMAQAELRHGHNEQLRRIAQEIIVDQQQEIAAMRLALDQPLPPSVAAPDQPADLWKGAPDSTSTPAMNVRKEP
jgi:Domain of unknown function (DUF305)